MSGVGTLVGVGLIFVVNFLLVLKFFRLLFTTFHDPSSSYGFTDFHLGSPFAAFFSSSQQIPFSWRFSHFGPFPILLVVVVFVGVGIVSFLPFLLADLSLCLVLQFALPFAFTTASFAHSSTIELVVFAIALICSDSWHFYMSSILLSCTSF